MIVASTRSKRNQTVKKKSDMENCAEGPTIFTQLDNEFLRETDDVPGSPTVSLETVDNLDEVHYDSLEDVGDQYLSVSQVIPGASFKEDTPATKSPLLVLPSEKLSGKLKVDNWLRDSETNFDEACEGAKAQTPRLCKSYRSLPQQVEAEAMKNDAADIDPYVFMGSQKTPRKRGRPPMASRRRMSYSKLDLKRHFKAKAYNPIFKKIMPKPQEVFLKVISEEDSFPINVQDAFDKLVARSPLRKLPRMINDAAVQKTRFSTSSPRPFLVSNEDLKPILSTKSPSRGEHDSYLLVINSEKNVTHGSRKRKKSPAFISTIDTDNLENSFEKLNSHTSTVAWKGLPALKNEDVASKEQIDQTKEKEVELLVNGHDLLIGNAKNGCNDLHGEVTAVIVKADSSVQEIKASPKICDADIGVTDANMANLKGGGPEDVTTAFLDVDKQPECNKCLNKEPSLAGSNRDVAIQCMVDNIDGSDDAISSNFVDNSENEISYMTRIKLRRPLNIGEQLPRLKVPFYLLGSLFQRGLQMQASKLCQTDSLMTSSGSMEDCVCLQLFNRPPNVSVSTQTLLVVENDHLPKQSIEDREDMAIAQEISRTPDVEPEASEVEMLLIDAEKHVRCLADQVMNTEKDAMDSEDCVIQIASVEWDETPSSLQPRSLATKSMDVHLNEVELGVHSKVEHEGHSGVAKRADTPGKALNAVCLFDEMSPKAIGNKIFSENVDIFSPSPRWQRALSASRASTGKTKDISLKPKTTPVPNMKLVLKPRMTTRKKFRRSFMASLSDAHVDVFVDKEAPSQQSFMLSSSSSDVDDINSNASGFCNETTIITEQTTSKELVPETEDLLVGYTPLLPGLSGNSVQDILDEPLVSNLAKDTAQMYPQLQHDDMHISCSPPMDSLDLVATGHHSAAEYPHSKNCPSEYGVDEPDLFNESFNSPRRVSTDVNMEEIRSPEAASDGSLVSPFLYSGMSTRTEYLNTQDCKKLEHEIDVKKATVKLMEQELKSKGVNRSASLDVFVGQDVDEEPLQIRHITKLLQYGELTPNKHRSKPSSTSALPRIATSLDKPVTNLVFAVSGLTSAEHAQVKEMANFFKAKMTDTVTASNTHLLVKTGKEKICCRTIKYLMGLANHCWILKFEWAAQCIKLGYIVAEDEYEVIGDKSYDGQGGPRISRLSAVPLFKDHEFHCIASIGEVSHDDWSQLLSLTGATHITDPSLFSYMPNRKSYIIGSQESMAVKDCNKLYQKYRIPVVDQNWVFDSLSSYTLQPVEPFLLMNNGDI